MQTASQITDTTNIGNVLDFAYNFSVGTADNGNVTAITNNRDTARGQSFTYDSLNRLATAQTTATTGTKCWGETFSYDSWANLLAIGAVTGYTGCTQENLSVIATTKNQISGDTHDAAGNMTNAPSAGSYTYNAENQLTLTAGVTYSYDGDGRRIRKSSGKLYWYGMESDPIAESDAGGNITDEYVFFGGRRIAHTKWPGGTVNYYFADHLGTSRVVTNSAGVILDDSDFYPFGGERPILSTSGNNYKFTGKERDYESGLDNFGARYNASTMGRFMTPDPIHIMKQRFIDPQQWNMYAYVRNNPLRFTDPTGMYTCADSKKCDSANDKTFAKDLDKLKAARDTYEKGSKDYKRLDKVIAGYGEMNKRGPAIAFGKLDSGFGGAFNAKTNTITFDLQNLASNGGTTVGGKNFDRDLTVQEAHEGQHYVDRDLSLASSQGEYRAYETSASAARGVKFDFYGWGENGRGRIWDSDWPAAQRTGDFNRGFREIWQDHYQGEGPIVTPLDPYPNQ